MSSYSYAGFIEQTSANNKLTETKASLSITRPKGPQSYGSESLTQALISWGHDWICGIRVTHSWPWSKPASGQPWRIQTRARTTVSGILLRLTAHLTYECWCFLAPSNEAGSGPLELKARWNIYKNVCRRANRTWQGMEQGGAGWCYGRLSFSWTHKLHASMARLFTKNVEREKL